MLSTWSNTEIPPKPSRNAVKIIFIESFLHVIWEIELIPFVISKKPQIKGLIKEVSILRKLNNGEKHVAKTFIKPLDFKIEITLEKITTKPPISRIVEILLVILFANTSPKLEKVITCFFWLNREVGEVVDELFFQNLKIIPTLIQDRICVMKSNRPIVVLPNIKMPTVPIIKRGPELFVKLSNLSHSSLEQISFFLKLEAILAPTGYPLIIPIIKAKAPSPRTLNNGFIYLFRILPKMFTIFVCIKSSVETKNGNREGTTEVAHKVSPDFTAGRLDLENISKHMVKHKKNSGNIFLFIFKT